VVFASDGRCGGKAEFKGFGLDQYVPDLTVRRIPDATHWVIHEQPEVINQHIRAFINRG
jgi:pimeloyl-ACP methyl ester carboxylesterase